MLYAVFYLRSFDGSALPRYNLVVVDQEEDELPLYEYECKKCGRRVEEIQKFSDSPLTTCEFCKGELERLISASAIQFKGSGWYVTDYARKPSGGNGDSSAGTSAPAPDKAKEPVKTTEPATASQKKD
jgi:putative FmdB family regulatory protein